MNRTQDSLEIIEDCIAEDLEDDPQPSKNEIVNFKVNQKNSTYPLNEEDIEPIAIRKHCIKKANR